MSERRLSFYKKDVASLSSGTKVAAYLLIMEYESKYRLEPADVEKARRHSVLSMTQDGLYKNEEGTVEEFPKADTTYEKIQRFAGTFKIEQRGIERVQEDERTDTSLVNVGTMVCPQ